uniref:DNA-directed DNA polymerase n=1 Tax=Tanacetum cinerariifolium TaxID=118510 RepID=A0A6L2MP12_TANCI|nr:DNA-directed DNA polymerase [Tanacetum cinerariifolium]
MNTASSSGTGSLPSKIVPNPREDLKAITTQSGVTLAGPPVSPPPLSKEVDREPETITDQVHTGSTNNIPPLVVQPSLASTSFSTISSSKVAEVTKDTKLLKKLGDPDKFLIPCDFPEFDKCLSLADPGASINLMPLSIWKNLSLPELTSTQMILELVDQSTTRPAGIAEDVFVKVSKFHFPTDFVVVDYVVDPRVPLILRRPFLRTGRALIDVYACEEYVQEVLGFFDNSKSGNPTLISNPIIALSSPSLTLFEGGDFILEEIKACLTSKSIPPRINDTDLDLKGDIHLLEELLNNDPSLSPLLPKELNVEEIKTVKSSIDEPPELEFKELSSHLEYAFLEGIDKLPIIISKELKDKVKSALLKVLKSHKRAIAWKIFDIKGIDPRFYTHKILMEDDFKPTVQHQRRVNLKIHEVIKKKVIKLLDAGLIYPISDSPWVSPVHCVPKRVMLERLAENEFYYFLDGFFGYFQIPIDPQDQEKTTFTCPYGTFAYRCLPFGLCNAPGTFQRCMMAIFHDMIEKTMEVFIDDFLVFSDSFSSCLSYLDKMLQRCEETNLVLNWEKCHFMVKEGIVLGHKISKSGIEVNRAKVDVITKLPHPTFVKGV